MEVVRVSSSGPCTLHDIGVACVTLAALTAVVHTVAPRLRDECRVAALYAFGSVAHGDAGESSDLDLLVDFDGPVRFAGFMEVIAVLEDALGVRVDLVTRAALRPRLRPTIEAEARRIV
ncbi:MAG: nucleotidyltransferase family protein [Acidobacteria bacterium]|nr:nucleotidyltransferase family protein [Acidobacteriota bacterium]